MIESATKNARSWTEENHPNGWSLTPPNDPNKTDLENKADINGFIIVFDDTITIKAGHALSITYHTQVAPYNDETDFANNRAFQNATNDFYTYYSGYQLVQKSNPVSVTLMDREVEVQGDVWIDEDWDSEQQFAGNRRDYSQYAIIQELVGDAWNAEPTDPGKIIFHLTDERISANGNMLNEAARGTNTSIGESIRHFTFKPLGAAAYVEGNPLYGPDNYLNAGKHKIGTGRYSALKGDDPFHYSLSAAVTSAGLMDIFALTDRGTGHYMSDNPDNLAGAEERANALDSNFASGTVATSFSSYPFYIRYSNLVDESKDIGFRMTRNVELTKLTADNNKPLEGVKFEVYGPFEDTSLNDPATGEPFAPNTAAHGNLGTALTFTATTDEDGNTIYTFDPDGTVTELVTGKDGKINVRGLNWWKEYKFVETQAPAEYRISGAVATANAAAGTRIRDNGDGSFTLLVPDPAKTSAQKTDKVTVTNPRGMDVEFYKYAAEMTVNADGEDVRVTGDPLAGVTFGLFTDSECTRALGVKYDDEGQAISGTPVTAASDANGKVTFKLVPYGTYYMKETARTTANPYWDNNTIYKVEVKPKVLPNNPVAKVIISVYQSPASSERDTGMLEYITVEDSEGNITSGTYRILNVEVKLKVELIKVDRFLTAKKLKDATFALYAADQVDTTADPIKPKDNATVLQTVTTGEDGTASFGWMKLGTYYLKETQAPAGYQPDDKLYKLEISYNAATGTVSYIFDPATEAVTVEDGKASFSITAKNTPYIDFDFTKVSAEMEVGTDGKDSVKELGALKGVEFTLYTDDACTTTLKDKDGNDVKAVSDDNGKVEFKNLPYGVYYMKETDLGDDNEDVFWDNDTIYKIEAPKMDANGNPVYDNQKTDENGKPVVDENGNPVYEANSKPVVVFTAISGSGADQTESTNSGNTENGGTGGNTENGGAAATEETTPIRTGMLVEVKDSDGKVIGYKIQNLKVQFKIKLLKIDETAQKTPLKGAEFALYNAADMDITTTAATDTTPAVTTIKPKENAKPVKTVTTGDNGEVSLGWLGLNKTVGEQTIATEAEYYLVETKAPTNYVKLKEPVKITFNKDGWTYQQSGKDEVHKATGGVISFTVEVTNKAYGDLRIIKYLNKFELSEDAIFVFSVEGRIDNKLVYSNTAAVTFSKEHPTGQMSTVLHHIPAGAVVTVTEVYTGSHYELVIPEGGDGTETTTIVANRTVSVNFTNDYNEEEKGGHGLANIFDPISTDNGWEWTQAYSTPNDMPLPLAEAVEQEAK